MSGLKTIANEFLSSSPKSTLIHFDLSSNMVFDEGCKHVAKILRCDRTLQSLNLSDCKMRDDGFAEIMKSFQEFSLLDEEIFFRRKLRIEYYKLLQKAKAGLIIEKKGEFLETDQTEYKDALSITEEMLSKHAFTSECVSENDDFLCSGNCKLESLNISYNRLTKPSFDLILKTLMVQMSAFSLDKGLKRIVLDGNLAVEKCEDIRNTIEDLLLSKKRNHSVNGSIKAKFTTKRRKSMGGSSLASESHGNKESNNK